MKKRSYILKGKYRLQKREELLPIIRDFIERLSRANLKLPSLYDFEHFALEFMENEQSYYDPQSYESRLDADPSDPLTVKHYCERILLLLDCKEDYEVKLPCKACREAICLMLGSIILQYQKRR